MRVTGGASAARQAVGLSLLVAAVLRSGPGAWAQSTQILTPAAVQSAGDPQASTDLRRTALELERLRARQQGLEELAQRLVWGCAVLAVAVAALVVARWRGTTVTAQRLVVRGADRKERAVLGISDRGEGVLQLRGRTGSTAILLSAEGETPVLRLCDRDGKRRACLSLGADGSPLLELCDAQGRTRVSLGLTEDGGAGLGLCDAQGQARAGLGLKEGGVGALTFMDRAGRCRMQAGMVAEDAPQLDLHGPDGQRRGSLQVRADGMALLELGDAEGRVRTLVGVLEEGTALVGLLDPERRFRVGMGVRKDGKPRLDLYDTDGNTRATITLEEDGSPGFSLSTPSGSILFKAP